MRVDLESCLYFFRVNTFLYLSLQFCRSLENSFFFSAQKFVPRQCYRTAWAKATLTKILQRKRHVQASHWDPGKLTHFNRYFGEECELSSSKYLFKCVNFFRIPLTRLNVWIMLLNFSVLVLN